MSTCEPTSRRKGRINGMLSPPARPTTMALVRTRPRVVGFQAPVFPPRTGCPRPARLASVGCRHADRDHRRRRRAAPGLQPSRCQTGFHALLFDAPALVRAFRIVLIQQAEVGRQTERPAVIVVRIGRQARLGITRMAAQTGQSSSNRSPSLSAGMVLAMPNSSLRITRCGVRP